MEQITGLKTSDYYFDLPQELIAQDPLEDRASSRLLVMDKETGKIEHRVFSDIKEYLRPGDTLVLNDTKVIPARLLGTKEDTGASCKTREKAETGRPYNIRRRKPEGGDPRYTG